MSLIRKRRLSRISIVLALLLVAHGVDSLSGDLEQGQAAYSQGDFETALSHFGNAAKDGDADAQYALGAMYHDGEGVARDHAIAAHWYTKAAQRGNKDAQYWLCIMHKEGMGVSRDYLESFYWCIRAAEKGNAQALFALGQYYFDGLGYGYYRDHVRAYIWFKRASMQGDSDADTMLERLREDMTPLQVSEAERIAAEWGPGEKLPCSPNNPRARYC